MKMIQYNTKGHYIRSDQIVRVVAFDGFSCRVFTEDGLELFSDVESETIVRSISQETAEDT